MIIRHQMRGRWEDLTMAIQLAKQALAVTPPDHPGRAVLLHIHGFYLSIRYRRLGGLGDLSMEIKRAEETVAKTYSDHRRAAGLFRFLGHYIFLRFTRLGCPNDFTHAIELAQKVLAATPVGHAAYATHIVRLNNTLSARYRCLGGKEDLAAFETATEALEAIPIGNLFRPGMLHGLGDRFVELYEYSYQAEYLERLLNTTNKPYHSRATSHPNIVNI